MKCAKHTPGAPLPVSINWFYGSAAHKNEAMSPFPNAENRFFILGSFTKCREMGAFIIGILPKPLDLGYICFLENI